MCVRMWIGGWLGVEDGDISKGFCFPLVSLLTYNRPHYSMPDNPRSSFVIPRLHTHRQDLNDFPDVYKLNQIS